MLNSFLDALVHFAQRSLTYNYYTPQSGVASSSVGSTAVIFGALTIFFIILLVVGIATLGIIGRWKIYKKAGEEGWKSLIPIYSDYTMYKILNMEPLLCIISYLPVSHFFLNLVSSIKLAKSFHKGTGFGIGLFLFPWIFELILGFGSAKYTKLPSSK